jgi:FKBP-type peptidyl-prolyl cis-trans isomerase FkpA
LRQEKKVTRYFMRNAALAITACLGWACSDSPTSPVKSLEKIDVVMGTGTEATTGKTVTVHYTGWVYDENTADHHGLKFDSSVDRNDPYTFILGVDRVIQGWQQGVPGMRVGGRRTLIIPPHLGYGSAGNPPIPPNAALVFDIELLNVE